MPAFLLLQHAASCNPPSPHFNTYHTPNSHRLSLCAQKLQDDFERFASAMQAPATLRSCHALLRRLAAKREAACKRFPATATTDVAPLLKRLASRSPTKANGPPGAAPLERYPLRVFMCAFMVLKHPEVVFSKQGDREVGQTSWQLITVDLVTCKLWASLRAQGVVM